MNCSTLDFPLPFTVSFTSVFHQTHVHWVDDAIQPYHPLLPPFPPTLSLSQDQGLFQWVSSSHQVAKVLELQLQYQSFQWVYKGWFPLGLTNLNSLLSKGLSKVFSSTTETISSSQKVLSLLYGLNLTSIHDYWKNHCFDYMDLCQQSDVSAF